MASVRDELLFSDISWLMKKLDVPTILERLGVRGISPERAGQIWAFCPDHHLFVGREPSHPKWSINVHTGKTYCFTESRGSNLVYTVARLLREERNVEEVTGREAMEWMIGDDGSDMSIGTLKALREQFKSLKEVNKRQEEERAKHSVEELRDITTLLKNGVVYDTGYHYFMYPPGKKPTLIEKPTVDFFKVVECKHGKYANRVINPFYMRGELVGFCATDTLGQNEWLERHPSATSKNYRKVLFPRGFVRRECLFNFDNMPQNPDWIFIVEGARDVMKLHQFGYHAMAVLGSGITPEQVKLLAEKNPKRVGIMFDGDDAGYDANRKIHRALEEHFDAYKAVLPRGDDPKTVDEAWIKAFLKKVEEGLA